MWRWFTAVLDMLIPPHPDACAARALTIESLAMLQQPQQLVGASWIHSILPYHNQSVRAAIKAIKYYGERAPAAHLAALGADYLAEIIAEHHAFSGWESVVILPIPAAPARQRRRGYNQAARIAEPIAAMLGARYIPELLTRADRQSQVRISRSERKKNIAGAFSASPEAKGAFVILIDDVVESGATLKDARRALLEAGARGVLALAIAH